MHTVYCVKLYYDKNILMNIIFCHTLIQSTQYQPPAAHRPSPIRTTVEYTQYWRKVVALCQKGFNHMNRGKTESKLM